MLARPILAAIAVLGGACSSEQLPVFGTRTWVGDNLEFWTTDDATVCGGSFEALDRHAELLSEFAAERGVETREERYRYFWLSQEELADEQPCAPLRGPCYKLPGPNIYAAYYSSHEVVHAELASGHSSFVDEGLATLFGETSLSVVPVVDVPALVDETRGQNLDGDAYLPAAKFVRAMEELYPEESLPALLTSQPSDDFDTFTRRLTTAGLDIDPALRLYAAEENCRMDAVRISLSGCAVPPTAWGDDGWRATGRLDCSDPNTLGPSRGDSPEIWTVRSVDIPRAGKYTAWLESDLHTLAGMVFCENSLCGSGFGRTHNLSRLFPVGFSPLELEAGRYWFRVARLAEDGPGDEFELRIIEGWATEDPRLDEE